MDCISKDGNERTFHIEGIADAKHTREKISGRQLRPWNGFSIEGKRVLKPVPDPRGP